MAAIPAAAHINCFDRNAYSDPNRSRAITADAENTITSPTNTRSMVTVNSQRSTLTRFASEFHFTTAARRSQKELLIVERWLLLVLVRGRYRDLACNGSLRAIDNVAGLDLSADSAAFGNSQVIVILKIQPKLRGQAKILSQTHGSVGAGCEM